MGPNGLPGVPGVKVSLRNVSVLPFYGMHTEIFFLSSKKFIFHRVIKESRVLVSR